MFEFGFFKMVPLVGFSSEFAYVGGVAMIFCPFLSKWYPLFWSWTKNTMDKNGQKWTIMDKNGQKINTYFNHFVRFSSN